MGRRNHCRYDKWFLNLKTGEKLRVPANFWDVALRLSGPVPEGGAAAPGLVPSSP